MESTSRKVLIVDPDPSTRALLLAILRRGGLEADCAPDHDQAVEFAASNAYSAAIVEPRMPYGDLLLRTLAETGANGRPSIIVATTPDPAAARFARHPGVVAVLLKPFQVDDLFDVVSACCVRPGSEDGRERREQ